MVTKNKQTWVFPANISIIDIKKAFRELGQIDWKTLSRVSAGDTVYIYFTSPIKKIVLVSQVTDVKGQADLRIQNYFYRYRDFQEYKNKRGKYVRLKFLHELPEKKSDRLSLYWMKKNGLKTVSIRKGIIVNNNEKMWEYFKKVLG
jgi:hypothetical protein